MPILLDSEEVSYNHHRRTYILPREGGVLSKATTKHENKVQQTLRREFRYKNIHSIRLKKLYSK